MTSSWHGVTNLLTVSRLSLVDYRNKVLGSPFCKKWLNTGLEQHVNRQNVYFLGELYPFNSVLSCRISSVFFGGGTPSLAQTSTISAVLETVSKHAHLSDEAEVTLEVNPTPAGKASLKDFTLAGVNRFSVGIQVCCMHMMFRSFDQVSIDLMLFSTVAEWWSPEGTRKGSRFPACSLDRVRGQDALPRTRVSGCHVCASRTKCKGLGEWAGETAAGVWWSRFSVSADFGKRYAAF